MIYGVGIDLVDVARVKKLCQNKSFINRVFTDTEQSYASDDKSENRIAEIYAGNFAVKEALSKALGTGIRGFNLVDIEVLRDDMGKPYVLAHHNLTKILLEKGIETIHVSISHTSTSATAVCVLERGSI